MQANGYMSRIPSIDRPGLSSSPMQFDGQGLRIRRAAPDIGEHTAEVFREMGLSSDEIDGLRGRGALA